jgi:cytochrome c553
MVEQYLSDYIRALTKALNKDNPNDSATEIWNDKAIEQLASYYYNQDYAIYDLAELEDVYKIYDVLKWLNDTRK